MKIKAFKYCIIMENKAKIFILLNPKNKPFSLFYGKL